jgi:hypothetical protein
MRPSRPFSSMLRVRTQTVFAGTLALLAGVATANCGDGDEFPDGGDGGKEGGTSGTTTAGTTTAGTTTAGTTTAGTTTAGTTTAGTSTGGDGGADANADAHDGGDGGDGGDGSLPGVGRALEWTVTSTGQSTKIALGRGFDTATQTAKTDVCVQGTLSTQTKREPLSFGALPSGSEFNALALTNQYLSYAGPPSWVTEFVNKTMRPPGGSHFLLALNLSGDDFFLSEPKTRTAATDCGDAFVGSYAPQRTQAIVVTVWPEDTRSVMPSFPAGGAGIFDPARRAELEAALLDADAHISIQVLEGTGHQTEVEAILTASTCVTTNLTACQATYEAIRAYMVEPSAASDDNLANLPGVDWPLAFQGSSTLTGIP